jgi:hypothetical protein
MVYRAAPIITTVLRLRRRQPSSETMRVIFTDKQVLPRPGRRSEKNRTSMACAAKPSSKEAERVALTTRPLPMRLTASGGVVVRAGMEWDGGAPDKTKRHAEEIVRE